MRWFTLDHKENNRPIGVRLKASGATKGTYEPRKGPYTVLVIAPDSMSKWIHLAALNQSLFLSARIWPCWTVKWDRLVPSFNSCQHLLIMARTVLIKRGTHLPSLLALHWLTEPHDSTRREDHGEQKRSHLAAAELIGTAGRNHRKGWHHVRQLEEFSIPHCSDSTFSGEWEVTFLST